MKIRGNTVGTPIKPEKSLVNATDLTEEQKAQARENIGIGGIDKYGNATFPEVYAERVTICDQLGVGVYVETAYDEHGTPELYFYGSEGDERVALKNVERFHAGEVLAESLTFPYTTEDGEKYVNASTFFHDDRAVLEFYDDTDSEVFLGHIATPRYDNEAANKRYVDEAVKEEWIEIVNTTLAEDVAYIATNTDINGNPFLCKKLVLQAIFANQPKNNFYLCSKMDMWSGARIAAVIPQDSNNPNREIVMELWVNEGKFAMGSFGARANNGKPNGYYMTVGNQRSNVLLCEGIDKALMSEAFFSNNPGLDASQPLPAGTIVRIWGLKA